MVFINFFILFFIGLLFASQDSELPIGLSASELDNLHIIDEMGRSTPPPPPPVRNIAEYERMEGVLIRYPFGVSTSLIREMSEDITIYCLVSSNLQNSAYNSMNNANVNMDNVEFVLGSTDSYWTRDYGPWWVVDGNKEVGVVDFTYNRPRPNDNQAPQKMSNYLNTPYYSTDLEHCGGNYMTDGIGGAASTTLVYSENTYSNNQVNNLMQDYYGIETYHVIEDPNNTYIDHIDCWGKYLSPSKILIRSVPISHPQYSEIEEVVDYFENTYTGYGNPWEIFRVYTPSDQPYTNSIILNNKVFVPIMNSSWDDDAIEVYEQALPGYEVLGFTGSWQSTDALHCRTKGIPDLEMLQIFHSPIQNQSNPQNFYTIEATIDDLSQTGLVNEELKVYWWTDDSNNIEELTMSACAEDIPDCYSANIPSQPVDANIKYYIEAMDNSGRLETLPMAGYFNFNSIGIPSMPGDVNQDESVNILDIVLTVNGILGTSELSDIEFQLADMNGDGVLNILDVILIANEALN